MSEPADPDAGRTGKGAFVASSSLATDAYVNAASANSVCGYAQRMAKSIGMIYLGLDEGLEYQRQSGAINAAIMAITEVDAFELAYAAAKALPADIKGDIGKVNIAVLAAVARAWFDLPDGAHVHEGGLNLNPFGAPHCPGDYAAPSGYIFMPSPNLFVAKLGEMLGRRLRKAVVEFVKEKRSQPSTLSGTLSTVIFASMSRESEDLVAQTLVGVMMGFLPTAQENLKNVVSSWRDGGAFEALQARYRGSPQLTPYLRARSVLAAPMMTTMQDNPVPPAVWRTATRDHMVGGNTLVEIKKDEQLEVRIAEATRADKAAGVTDVFPVFGGDRRKAPAPTHGCPGYQAAIGVMLGVLAGLMD